MALRLVASRCEASRALMHSADDAHDGSAQDPAHHGSKLATRTRPG
ncbi:Hypothetical protein A7982_02262 [Minicystis rosea]|nr:Hypothetical protein A7982_02262 [Minicystis rosea]